MFAGSLPFEAIEIAAFQVKQHLTSSVSELFTITGGDSGHYSKLCLFSARDESQRSRKRYDGYESVEMNAKRTVRHRH